MLMTVKILSLQALSDISGETYTNLRQIIFQLKKSKQDLVWNGYQFEKAGGAWLAYPVGSDVQIIDRVAGQECNPTQLGEGAP